MLAQKQPPFQKCVIAYWSRSSAPIMNGTKHDTETADAHLWVCVVEERCSWSEAGRQRSVDRLQVIMPERVTRKQVRILFAESLRFPGEGKSAQGQSDPKARPKGVADGQQVNIPAPLSEVEEP
eukprot:TRINITY_DN9231_c1_g1_i1.p3 TRINITY_DN9231_c1_g1~~TRINITY_DN9231_c1_g1_i1.p3  ORF type:complete len:124 (-),score=15.34 TRINITY_DN9231_c1_g1_i1:191-562(-)